MLITKEYHVDYAHRLPDHKGLCKNLHGHTGTVRIMFQGQVNEDTGMVIDFGNFGWLEEIVYSLDHAVLLKTDDFLVELLRNSGMRRITFFQPPTAEVIAKYLAEEILACLKSNVDGLLTGLDLRQVIFIETPGNEVCYTV